MFHQLLMEKVKFISCTAENHQGELLKLWLHLKGVVVLFIFYIVYSMNVKTKSFCSSNQE